MENICRFIPVSKAPDIVQTIHFVYETQRQTVSEPAISAVYQVSYVTEGTAEVSCSGNKKTVGQGDIFFLFPSVPYTIEGSPDFRFMYISYIGIRANMLMERFHINSRNFVFEDFPELFDRWNEGILLPDAVMDTASESVLLYTLSKIGERQQRVYSEEQALKGNEKFLIIKKYVDDNFSDCTLSLETISKAFSYNKKYISTAFKERFKVGIREYINMVRINHACALIDQKYTGVNDIAFLCGFNDPLYFSKVFKQKTGLCPKDYIAQKK